LPLPSAKAAPKTSIDDHVTAETLGRQLRAALPQMRVHSLSIYDGAGDVLWLSEGALGPDEHSVVVDGMDTLRSGENKLILTRTLDDGRSAILLAVRAPRGDLVGLVMILADPKSLKGEAPMQSVTAPLRATLQKIAVLLRVKAGNTGATSAVAQIDVATNSDTVALPDLALMSGSLPVLTVAQPDATSAVFSPKNTDDFLTFELMPEPSSAPPKVQPKAPPGAAAQPQGHSAGRTPPNVLPAASAQPKPPSAAPAQPKAPPAGRTPSASAQPPKAPPAASIPGPMTDQEQAADLILDVQQLTQLRSGGRTRRYEVLARSRRDAARKHVPAAFVAPAARGPEGAALDSLVLKQLLTWLGANPVVWEAEPASFSINLSIGALEDAQFLHRLPADLASTGVAAQCIGFEISEQACSQCPAQVERFVASVEKIGCFLVLDNFSLAPSALQLLRSPALRLVKIDARLTSSALQDKLSQALVVAIAQACKVLGIHCVAKSVETQAALQWLTGIGCDLAQGFVLDRPLPLDSLAAPAGCAKPPSAALRKSR
jgi:EAL domain-containing protein (putative c-di-GMP-specific phosphodiesterase class I)